MSNNITVVGNLTKDPELRFIPGGQAICNASLAASRRYQVNGEWQEETSFFNLSIWGPQGENVAASMHKGSRAIVTGYMKQRSYDNDEGKKVYVWDLIVNEIGPSLRWARCEIEKVTREQSAQGHDHTAAASSGNRPPDPVYGEEEPF